MSKEKLNVHFDTCVDSTSPVRLHAVSPSIAHQKEVRNLKRYNEKRVALQVHSKACQRSKNYRLHIVEEYNRTKTLF